MTINILLQLVCGFFSLTTRWYMRKKSLWAPVIDFLGRGLFLGVVIANGMYGTSLFTVINLVLAVLVYRKWKKDKRQAEQTGPGVTNDQLLDLVSTTLDAHPSLTKGLQNAMSEKKSPMTRTVESLYPLNVGCAADEREVAEHIFRSMPRRLMRNHDV